MLDILKKVIGSIEDKKEYKNYKKRISKLPNDYKNTFEGIEKYMMHFGTGDMVFIKTLYSLLDMFEESVAENKKVSDIVGEDLGAFCEDIFKAIPEISFQDVYKKKIQKRIDKKIIKKDNK